MIYGEGNTVNVPEVDVLSFLFDSRDCHAEEHTPLHAEASDPDNVLTKAGARILTKHFAHFLRSKHGIGRDGPGKDVVTVITTGQSRLPCLFYGVVAAEGVYSAASPGAPVPELVRQFKDSAPKLLVCSNDVKPLVIAAAEQSGIPVSNVLVLESAPQPRLYNVDGTAECDMAGSLDWRRITNKTELEESLVCLVYSSGTTNIPKGVRISHSNMVSQCFIPSTMNRPIWKTWSPAFESRALAHLPATHISGIQGYLVNPFFDGGIVYWMPKFDFVEFVRYNASLRITTFFTIPPIYMAIAKQPFVTDQFSNLRVANCGGAAMSKDLQAAASAKLGGGKTFIVQNWGMTEASGAVTHLPPDRKDPTGSLSLLMPNMRLRLVNDDGSDVGPEEAGEALLQGPFITRGYHNSPEADKEWFTEDGWMRTGDVLRFKDDLLYLVDRKKDLIKAGKSVAPAEIEGVLVSHPLIVDAAVAGVYSEEHGHELIRAYVVTAPQAKDQLTAEGVVEFVKGHVSDYKGIRGGVVFIPAVPRSPIGKILRKKLAEIEV